MRVFVPVFVIAIIAVTILLIVRSVNRTSELKQRARDAARYAEQVDVQARDLRATVAEIKSELNVQLTAGYFDPAPLQVILNNHDKKDITT